MILYPNYSWINRRLGVVLHHGKKNGPNASKASQRTRAKRTRKNSVRTQPRRDSGRTLANARELSPLVWLVQALRQEKIRFQVVGMSAAILQGCPSTTLDTDLWIDLPSRQYMRVLRLCQALGAIVRANTVVEFNNGSLVNFLYHVDGLFSFDREYRQARRIKWLGTTVAVLPLDRILHSKTVVGRPKDIAHLPLLKETIALTKRRRLNK